MSNKKQIILKQNAIISGGIVDASEDFSLVFNANEHDMVNALLYILQDSIRYGESTLGLFNFEDFARVAISQDKLIKLCRISPARAKEIVSKEGDRNITYIEQVLRNVRDSSIMVSNTRLPVFDERNNAVYNENGDLEVEKVKKAFFGIIEEVRIKRDPTDERKNSIFITFNKTFLALATKQFSLTHGNYSALDSAITSKMQSRHAKRLCEFLFSRKDFGVFTVPLDALRLLFFMTPDTQGSYIVKTIDRIHDTVNTAIPFSYEYHKADKKITFRLSPKN